MKHSSTLGCLAAGLALGAAQAGATTLNFEDLAEGATLSNQYAGLGVVFSPNAFSGPGGPTGPWSEQTGMTITATDIGNLGLPPLLSGKLLHSDADWQQESDGDASFLITFTTPISSFSADFGGINRAADVRLFVYDGATLLATVAASCALGGTADFPVPCQQTLSFSAASITQVAVGLGSFDDWVAVDNISFTAAAVPELGTCAMMGLGLGLLACKRRKPA
jgi:hypothetical protein